MRFFHTSLLAPFFLLLCMNCFSTPSISDYGNLPSTSLMVLSPDGNSIAFRRVESKHDTLMIYSLKDQKLIRAVDVSEVVPENIYFISKNQLIIQAASHKKLPGFKGSHDVRAAFVLNVTSGKLEQLLRLGDNIYLGQTNVSKIIGISKNKKIVYMPALVGKSDSRSFRRSTQGAVADETGYAVMKVDLDSPKLPIKISRDHNSAIDYFMGPNDEILVEERYNEYGNRHEVLVKNGSKWHHIYDKKVSQRNIDLVGLTPDYKSLVVLAYGANDRRQYSTMSLKDGSLTDVNLNKDGHDIEGVITDINRIVYGVRYSGFLPSYKLFDENLDKRIHQISTKFPGNSVSLTSWSKDWRNIVVYVSGSNYSGEYYLFDGNLKQTFLSNTRPKINNDNVHPIATVTLTAQDGSKIPTLLTIPKSNVTSMKNLPAVILPHGGPRSYDSISFNWITQALANEGYLVVQPQFRGSEGFGWSFIEAGYGEWGGKMLDDIDDTLSSLIKKGLVDKNRVCIAGASYGGYAALALGANTPNKYQCVVSINGVSNMVSFLSKDKHKFGKYHSWIDQFKKYVDLDNADKDKLKSISPHFKAKAFTAPVLLIHGENDGRVDLKQSKSMASRLKKANRPVTMVKLKDENHYLQKNESRLKVLSTMVSFINTHLK